MYLRKGIREGLAERIRESLIFGLTRVLRDGLMLGLKESLIPKKRLGGR
ncbi:MAG: hypothetical protein ABIK99_03980 [candidate division WOR-3 bacterium]